MKNKMQFWPYARLCR